MLTYPLNFIEYEAAQAQTYHATRSSGIFSDGDFRCSASGEDNTITISAGLGWIAPRKFEGMSISEQTETTKDLSIADALLPRWDIIAIQFDREKNKTDIIVKKGTAHSDPQIPERVTTELIYELYLCKIYRPAGSVVIDPANITDLRLDKQYCGIMSSAIDEIDTQGIVEQANGVIKNLNTNGEKEIQKIKTNGEQLITELQKKIKEVEGGASDMLKITYDTNNSGTVDDSEKLGGKLPSHYAALETQGITLYTQNPENGNLTSDSKGSNGKFKATKTGSFETINVNGTPYKVKTGGNTGIDVISGVWYNIIIDDTENEKTINFITGGGKVRPHMGCFNFEIIASEEKPLNPKNNTLWLKTSEQIGEWVISRKPPKNRGDGSELENFDIWIETTRENSIINFNAVNNYGINIMLANVYIRKQQHWYWVSWQFFQQKLWYPDNIYIFDGENNVDEIENTQLVEGGIIFQKQEYDTGVKKINTIYFNNDATTNRNPLYGYSGIKYPLDLTNYSRLTVNFAFLRITTTNDSATLALQKDIPDGTSKPTSATTTITVNSLSGLNSGVKNVSFSVDITELKGIHYFQLNTYSYDYSSSSSTDGWTYGNIAKIVLSNEIGEHKDII